MKTCVQCGTELPSVFNYCPEGQKPGKPSITCHSAEQAPTISVQEVAGGNPTVEVSKVPCCHRDTDGDGNCPVHKRGVEFPAGTIQEKLDNWFAYHKPVGDQAERYEKLRAAGKVFAEAIVELVPDCADRAVAIRKVRDAVMNANAGIACGGK